MPAKKDRTFHTNGEGDGRASKGIRITIKGGGRGE